MIRRIVLISCFLVLVLLCAGCLTAPWGENSAGSGEKSGVVLSESSPGSSGLFSGAYRSPAPLAAADGSQDLAADQKIIKTSLIYLEVQNVTATMDPLKGIATTHGGYIGTLSVNTRYGDRLYAILTMRVPAGQFESAISEIKALGSLTSESLSADDVTEEYVDLQARRTALASQLAAYNRIMEKAENVSEILDVQVQIERVQVEIDRIDGRLKYLDNRVDYATITVTLEEPEPVGSGERFSFISVINEGITGFLTVAAGLVIILISIIPLIILGAAIYGIFRWWKGRKGQMKKQADVKEEKKEGNHPGQ